MNLLSIETLSPDQISTIIKLSQVLTHAPPPLLLGKNILFAFAKPSLRTLVGTEVAINKLAGQVIHVAAENFFEGKIMHAKTKLQLEGRESLRDTVMNVSQWCDAIFARVYQHQTLQDIAQYSTIPVINALSDQDHPMQALADLLTIQEHFGTQKRPVCIFVGDANNVAFSLAQILLMQGYEFRLACPETYNFSSKQLQNLQKLAQKHQAHFEVGHEPSRLLKNAKIIVTDTFVSMGEEEIYHQKIQAFDGFQVNTKLMSLAHPQAIFLHCLPAYRGVEVTNEVIEGPQSFVYKQAKNRMRTAMGLFAWLLAPESAHLFLHKKFAKKRRPTAKADVNELASRRRR